MDEEKIGFIEKMSELHKQHRESNREQEEMALKNWRSWGSWFSWGSPIGLGLFFVEIGAFLVLLHYAGLIR